MQTQDVKNAVDKASKDAQRELKKVQKTLEDAGKKVDAYVTKNPKQAAAISAGIGAAIGAALAMMIGRKKK